MQAQPPLGRQRHLIKAGQRAAGVGQNLADLALGLRVGIEHLHVPAHQQEPRGPAAPDHAAANNRRHSAHRRLP